MPSQGIRGAPRHNFTGTDDPGDLRPELSWTHYRLLLGVEDARARDWYMNEAADQHWSTRQLDRQISALYYERLLASRKKKPVRKKGRFSPSRTKCDGADAALEYSPGTRP